MGEGGNMNTSASLKQLVAGVFSQDNGLAVSLPARMPETVPKPIKRTKLWELETKHYCPIIGTCLPMDDLVRFARRFAFGVSLRDEFSLHVEAVDRVGVRNEVSEAIQKHLDMKYHACITRFELAKTDADVLALWQEHYTRGEVAGAMWAALTHKAVSDKTRQVVYTDVHMLSHQVGAGQAADVRRLAHLQKENAEARAAMERQQRQQTRAEAELREQLHKAMAELESLRQSGDEVAALQARIAAFESGMVMMKMKHRLMCLTAANEQMRVVAERSGALEKALKAAHSKTTALSRERDELATERDALECLLLAGKCRRGSLRQPPLILRACDARLLRTLRRRPHCTDSPIPDTGRAARHPPDSSRRRSARSTLPPAGHDQQRGRRHLPHRLRQPLRLLPVEAPLQAHRQALPVVQGRGCLRLRRGAGTTVFRPDQPTWGGHRTIAGSGRKMTPVHPSPARSHHRIHTTSVRSLS